MAEQSAQRPPRRVTVLFSGGPADGEVRNLPNPPFPTINWTTPDGVVVYERTTDDRGRYVYNVKGE